MLFLIVLVPDYNDDETVEEETESGDNREGDDEANVVEPLQSVKQVISIQDDGMNW